MEEGKPKENETLTSFMEMAPGRGKEPRAAGKAPTGGKGQKAAEPPGQEFICPSGPNPYPGTLRLKSNKV